MSSPHRPVDPQQSFPALEDEVLARWKAEDVFPRTVANRAGAEPWVFYEGPPTANGRPGVHHVLARVFKDIFPRYRTMTGYRVERKGGWDTHGLPVELAVEAELGFDKKEDIEEYGIARFNAKCRESVFTYLEDWSRLTERIGYWVDLDDAYRTLDNSYIESVWWALKTIWEKGLLTESYKVVPHCPRDQVTLSSHELGQPGAYRDVVDPSVYVRFPVTEPAGPLHAGDELLIWTTTPWTLPSNAAVAVDPELTYVRARSAEHDAVFVLAEALVERVLGEGAEVVERFPGAAIEGARYEPPFGYIPGSAYGERGHTVLVGDFVTAVDGTGIVHTAIAFGEDDFRLGEQYGLTVVNPVKPNGTYDDRMGAYAGRGVKDADRDLVEDLRGRGRLLRAEEYEHAYPHCWRCGTPLIYYAKPSWYIRTSQIRDRLLASNETVNWHPPHVKHGRFGNWLEGNVDWALSRERYWGTPLPIWRCENGHVHAIGSFDELEERSGVRLDDAHRPYVDEVSFPCAQCNGRMTRVPEVIDVWFDSGAMPFAQWHAPHENAEVFRERFPADYVCEALDQTRGWFYSLLAVSTLLFDQSSYKNVVCLGLILDGEGQKMSKSRGNVVVPDEVLDRFGADALRWYFFTSKQPWDGYRFSHETIGEMVRQFLLQLWNTYGFYVMYANANDVAPPPAPDPSALTNDLDRWALSRLSATVETVRERMDDYDATTAGRAIQAFVDDLSNWYVRRSRRRFWDGDADAFATLRHCLVAVAQMLAPFTPFFVDEIYRNLDPDGPSSVHLTDFPVAAPRDEELEFAMGVAREAVTLGLAARGQSKIKLRQPLHAAVIVATGRERAALERLADVVRDELNVKELRFAAAADELGRIEVKPNYRALGPRFGKSMPMVAAAVAGLDPAHVATALREGRTVGISIDGRDHSLGAEDLITAMQPLDGYQLEREGSHAVALELTLDDALRREGIAREIVHAIQAARKNAGLDISDRIALTLGGGEELAAAVNENADYISRETLATTLSFDTLVVAGDATGDGGAVRIDGEPLSIAVART
ncbi:isoleucine--tRNA ligase [Conexibacter woesei]|uniref:Isoleucine--tRNA ligase n=1 Tax=Conexibacter woesei (strain DSM 14684 / CCUG 47730 / CIP 108061 / JCM 11494 / NBRC 100937 / ID131577) TaxID=469383 RepID=D3F2W5_CONWI|nr:isoleucine--tRNA ligase [Conexibacter woesei]ADB54246.1 isoleucyl-tRNA synthetase [Conexibacter woesei DSM 14684]